MHDIRRRFEPPVSDMPPLPDTPPGRYLRTGMALAGYVWAAPCTVLGLALSVSLRGTVWRVVDGVIEIAPPQRFRTSPCLRALPFNAITFGHVVFATSVAELDRLRVHEHAHVRQYERWGILFLLAYPASSLWEWARGRRAYADNWFEVQARTVAGEEPPGRGRRTRA